MYEPTECPACLARSFIREEIRLGMTHKGYCTACGYSVDRSRQCKPRKKRSLRVKMPRRDDEWYERSIQQIHKLSERGVKVPR